MHRKIKKFRKVRRVFNVALMYLLTILASFVSIFVFTFHPTISFGFAGLSLAIGSFFVNFYFVFMFWMDFTEQNGRSYEDGIMSFLIGMTLICISLYLYGFGFDVSRIVFLFSLLVMNIVNFTVTNIYNSKYGD